MAFCRKCGRKLNGSDTFCPHCGEKVPRKPASDKVNDAIDSAAKAVGGVFDTNDSTGGYDANDAKQNNGLCVLCYLGLLVLIPLLTKKESRFVRFHCNQGLVLILAYVALGIVVGVADALFTVLRLSLIGTLLKIVFAVAVAACVVFGIVNAANGKAKELPVIGGIRLLK